MSGTNSKGQFSIKDGVSKNYELDDGSGLIVMEDTQAIDTILDEHATMQSLGKDTGTKVQANAVYDLGRSYQNGSITYSSKAISENMVINNGRANVWAGTMVNVSVRGNDGILEVMKPQINYAPAMLVGKVVVSEGASLERMVPWIPAKRTFRSKIAYGPSLPISLRRTKTPSST